MENIDSICLRHYNLHVFHFTFNIHQKMAVFTFIDFGSFLRSGWFSNNFFFSSITANFFFFKLDLGKDSI